MGTSVSNIITVTTPPLGVAPGPALGLSVSNITSSAITLLWSAPASGTTPFTYTPQISVAGSGFFTAFASASGVTSATASGLTPNVTYLFAVSTQNSTGTSISATTSATTLAIPVGAPTGLAVVGSPTQSSVSLQWSAPTTGTSPITYQVAYRTPSGSTGTFTPFPTTVATLTQTITGLNSGSGYDFIVTASNPAGAGPSSGILLNVQTAGIVANGPGPASSLTITNLTATSLTLSWTPPNTGSAPFTYQPQASISGGTFANIGSQVTAAAANLTGLSPATAYQFQIVTSNSTTLTSTSASVSTTTLAVVPSAPIGLTVVGSPTQTGISLQWTAPSTGTTPFTYQVLSRTPTGSGSFSAAAAATTAITQALTGLAPGTGYDLEVTASNVAGTGPASTILLNVQTAAGSIGSAPTAATGLTITNLTATSLTLSWTAPSAGTTPFSYQVQQALVGSSVFANTGGSLSTATTNISALSANTGYQFQIVTTNVAGSSTSASVSTTTLPIVPGTPSGLTLVGSPTQTSVGLQWTAPVTGTPPITYQVLSRTPTGSGSFTPAGAVVSTLTQTITGLVASSSYDFEIQAINAAGSSAPSSVLANILTAANVVPVAPSAPTNLAAGAVTTTTIPVSWSASATGTPPISYVVQWRPH